MKEVPGPDFSISRYLSHVVLAYRTSDSKYSFSSVKKTRRLFLHSYFWLVRARTICRLRHKQNPIALCTRVRHYTSSTRELCLTEWGSEFSVILNTRELHYISIIDQAKLPSSHCMSSTSCLWHLSHLYLGRHPHSTSCNVFEVGNRICEKSRYTLLKAIN